MLGCPHLHNKQCGDPIVISTAVKTISGVKSTSRVSFFIWLDSFSITCTSGFLKPGVNFQGDRRFPSSCQD